MSRFVIRRAALRDMTGVLELYRYLYPGALAQPGHAADQWSRLLVAEDQQRSALVGTCVVAMDHRRKGISSSLLRAALAHN